MFRDVSTCASVGLMCVSEQGGEHQTSKPLSDPSRLTCDPLSEVPDEPGVTVGFGSVSLKQTIRDTLRVRNSSPLQTSLHDYVVSYRLF